MSGETKTLIGIGIVTLVIIAIAIFSFSGNSDSTANETVTLTTDQQKRLVTNDSRKITAPNAKVTIVEFLDFECEACGAAHPILKKILEEYKGKVNFVVRNFPNHKNSVLAANAAEAAGEQGRYWLMYDKLFENQKTWGEQQKPQSELFLKYAQELNLDTDEIKSAMDDNIYSKKINSDKQEGIALGVDATPTFFINGEKITGVIPYDEFKKKVDEKLAK